MWLNQFKIAIIEKDAESIDNLIDEMPQFDSVEEMQQASALLLEATKLVTEMKRETGETMVQIKKNIDFLKSTQKSADSSLDLTL